MTYQVILVVAGVAINNRLKFQNSNANDFSNAPAVIVVFSLGVISQENELGSKHLGI